MTRPTLYEDKCGRKVSTKITEKQYHRLEVMKEDFGCASIGDTIRFIIDNFTVSSEPPKTYSPPEKKVEEKVSIEDKKEVVVSGFAREGLVTKTGLVLPHSGQVMKAPPPPPSVAKVEPPKTPEEANIRLFGKGGLYGR